MSFSGTFLGHTPQSIKSRLGMELRSQSKVSGSQSTPRATSEGRKQLGTKHLFNPVDTLVNSPSSPTGDARGGKLPSRILPSEGGPFRALSPNPRSESAGGPGGSPEEVPPRRRRQIWESGGAGGRPASSHETVVIADENGKPFRLPDEGHPEFTSVNDQFTEAYQFTKVYQFIKIHD